MCECRDRAKTLFRLLRQGTQDDDINVCREIWIECAGWYWLSMKVLIYHLTRSTLKGWASCQQFVGHDSQCILVGGRNSETFHLFRCHIRRGSSHALAGVGSCSCELGNAKVSQ